MVRALGCRISKVEIPVTDNYEALKVKDQEGCRTREIPSSTLGGGIKGWPQGQPIFL